VFQVFLDTSDAYVWLYDPIPWYYWGVGTVIVLGVIGVCLFPLWPPKLRLGVHYLSIAAAGFLVNIIFEPSFSTFMHRVPPKG
jgi:translocation protein SEC62